LGVDLKKIEVTGQGIYRLLYPQLVVLVSCRDLNTEKPNLITIAWSTPLSAVPPLVGISVSPKRYSHGLIEKSKEFVMNIPTMEILKKVAGCGSISGRDVDKFSRFGLTARPAKAVKPPVVDECIAHLECRLVDQVETGDHTFFIGEVVAAYVDEDSFDGQAIKLKKVRNIYQICGHNYSTLEKEMTTLENPF
jgi:flavin reductase (DIM6/NTAB) family NADH-FMN oxidoreductase RutF